MEPADSGPEPLPLVEFLRDPENALASIKLVDETLESLHERTGSRPLSIICICGPPPQGKSVLLGYLIRYLTALETNETDWFGWNDKNKPLDGFKCSTGSKPETQGIWVWSRPFVVKTEEGKEVAIVLINAQGCQGEIARIILGLSVLTSSIMIFNCSSTTQDELFNSLETYRQYGNLASEACSYKKTFQKLLFLIPDWKNLDEFPYGPQGGKRYLFKTLNIKNGEMSTLQDCVEDLQCFLMPHIGEKGLSPDFQGCVGELEPKFAQKLEQLIASLLSPEEILAKEIFGWYITAEDLKRILQVYLEIFNSKEKVSGAVLLQKTCRFHNERVVAKAIAKLTDVNKRKTKGRSYVEEDEIDCILNLGEQAASEFFQKESKFSTETDSFQFKEELHGCLRREKYALKISNKKSRNSYIHNVTEDTVTAFRTLLDSKFPFDEDQFYENATIQRAITQAKDQVLEDFKDKLDNESGERLIESVKNLETSMDTVANHILDRNNILREEAVELFDSWFWQLKDKVGTAVEGKSSRAVSEILGKLDHVIPLALQDKMIEKQVQNATVASPCLPGNDVATKLTTNEVLKVVDRCKQHYNQKCEDLWSNFCTGVDINTLANFHSSLCDEVKSSLSIELKGIKAEPFECHLSDLQTHINNYWLLAMSSKRLEPTSRYHMEQMKPEKETETQLKAHDNSNLGEGHNLQKQLRRESKRIAEMEAKRKKSEGQKTREGIKNIREEEMKRLKQEEENAFQENIREAASQINQTLVPSTYNFIDKHLNLNTIRNFGSIYTDVMNCIAENLKFNVPAGTWKSFRYQLDANCKKPAMEFLDPIANNVLEFNRVIRKKFEMLGYFDPDKLNVILEEECQKIIINPQNEEIGSLSAKACKQIGKVYLNHNGIIRDLERDLHFNMKPQLIAIYHEQMKRYMANAPFNPNKLADIHKKLSNKLVDALKNACRLQPNVYGEVGPALVSLQDELAEAFKLHQSSNELKLIKLQMEVAKIADNLKSEYHRKCEDIFNKYSDGVDAKILGKLHEAICVETKKLLEMEIRNKIRKDESVEPVESYTSALQEHMDSYWKTVLDVNRKNLNLKHERDKQAERDRVMELLKEQAVLQLLENEKNLSFDRGHRAPK